MVNVEIVKQILASDIVSWILAFLGGVLAFKLVDTLQTKIERHQVIKDMEQSINTFISNNIAMSSRDVGNKEDGNLVDVSVRTVLNDDPSWEKYSKDEKDKRKIKKDKRYIRIRKNNKYEEYISTQALHESLIIFRRIEKLYKDNILEPIDLVNMGTVKQFSYPIYKYFVLISNYISNNA